MDANRPARAPSLFARFRLNMLGYGYAQVVTLLAQLVQVPFFLHYWGKAGYADWLVLTGVPMLFILLDLGVTQASASRATISAGAGDWDTTRRSLQTALMFTLALAFAIVGLMALATPHIDWVPLLRLSTLAQADARHIALLMAVCLALQLLGGPVDAWFRAIDRAPLGAFLIANRRMADIAATITVLACGGTPVQLAGALCLVQLVLLAVIARIVARCSPQAMLGLRAASWQEFRLILKPALAYASFPLSQAVTLQGGLQVLNQLSDASAVVGYTMARTLVRLIIQFGVVANNALKPEISRLAGQGQMRLARDFTRTAARNILLACVAAYAALVVAGPHIIAWWGHGAVHVDSTTLALIGLHAVLNVAWFIPAALMIATNTHGAVALTYGIASVLALALWLALPHAVAPVTGAALLLAVPELCVLASLRAQARMRSRASGAEAAGATEDGGTR